MEHSFLISQLVAVIVLSLICTQLIFRESRDADKYDCRHLCEWQVVKIHETCTILIALCEEKLQKLHDSDMNMAIIREQLHKEILELFRYEFQTFQRLQTTKTEHILQVCSEYYNINTVVKHHMHDKEDCQSNVNKLLIENQLAVQRHRLFRWQVQRRLRYNRMNVNSCDTIHLLVSWSSVPCALLIICITILATMFVNWNRQKSNRVTAIEEERETFRVENCTMKEHESLIKDLERLKSDLDARKRAAEQFAADYEKLHLEFENCIKYKESLQNEIKTLKMKLNC